MAVRRVHQPEPSATGDGPPPTVGFLERQLEEEFKAKQSFETRGMAVISTSATLATLSFGIAKFATPGSAPIKGWAILSLMVALVGFVLAAVGGLAVNLPSDKYRALTDNGLEEMVSDERWIQDRDDLNWSLAQSIVAMIRGAREGNNSKTSRLSFALAMEIVAVVALLVTVGLLVNG